MARTSVNSSSSPIGIFDSGVGGLTVFKEVRKLLPFEDMVYLGDTARVPYGTKSQEVVIKYSIQNAEFLLSKGVKTIIVACNTASAASLPYLKDHFPEVEIIGVISPVVRYIKTNLHSLTKVAVVGTKTAITSGAYQRALQEALPGVKVLSKPCPLFVPLVEEGMFDHRVTDAVIDMYLSEIREAKVGAVILGCTHYPMLKKPLQKYFGEKVAVIDTAFHTAVSLDSVLCEKSLKNDRSVDGRNEFYVTDSVESFKKTAELFLKFSVDQVFHI